MKVYSEITKELYDTVEECQTAEEKFAKEEAAKKAKAEEDLKQAAVAATNEKNVVSKRKKELADAVEAADEVYSEACKKYDAAKSQAREILAEAQKKADAIISQAAKEVREASQKKFNAVLHFNSEFGTYRTVLTGSKALEEANRMLNSFWANNPLRDFFDL